MTTISPISYTSPSGLQLANPDRRDPMAYVAKALGMSRASLREALAAGKSLGEVATDRNVSHDDLVKAIQQGLPQGDQAGGDPTELAEKIAAERGGPAARGADPADEATSGSPDGAASRSSLSTGGSSGGAGACRALSDPDKLDQLASLLNMNSGQLASQATSAQSLVELLQKNNVGPDQLKPFLQPGDLIDAVA